MMQTEKKQYKIIISGGGTGGHIFPALAVANEIISRKPDSCILFIGAKGRMEMDKVPLEGFDIIGLDVVGIQRSFSLNAIIKNIKFPFLLLKSLKNAKKIIVDFRPDIVIGFGGYASGPTLKVANKLRIPTLIQEQNSYAGLTNKWLSSKASKICVAYEKMDKFFKSDKITITGNPVRKDIINVASKREEAIRYFKLNNDEKVILILGGSLGAKSINEGILKSLDLVKNKPLKVLWQVGKRYVDDVNASLSNRINKNISVMAFIKRMDLAYAASDVVISRAGALSISEISTCAKASILIPSPNVSEDHQTKNALYLVDKNAALIVKDNETEKALETAINLLEHPEKLKTIENNVKHLAKPNACQHIVDEIFNVLV